MGTSYSLAVYSDEDTQNTFSKVSNILENVNQEMSNYIVNSSISQINQAEIDKWITVSRDFLDVLTYAIDLCHQSNGVYDVSIGKLVNIWGFGPDTVDNKPTEDELNYLSSQVGCDSIILDDNNLSIKKVRDVSLDFSSIAKGFAIDKAYDFLVTQKQLKSFFIEIGGEIRATNFKYEKQPWKAGIIDPLEQQKIVYAFSSSDFNSFALATSGDYRNVRVFENQKLSHTIDTISGVPSNYSQKSVSVIAENAMMADALATALNAMPLDEAIEYSNRNRLYVLFITEEENSPKLLFSDELQRVKM
jgi:thiamine biosynthesis lipoprotein